MHPSNGPARNNSLGLRFLDEQDPEVAVSSAREGVTVSFAEERDRRGRRGLAVRENLHRRSGREALERLLRFDERVRAEEAAGVDAPVGGPLSHGPELRSVQGPTQMNVTTPPSFA